MIAMMYSKQLRFCGCWYNSANAINRDPLPCILYHALYDTARSRKRYAWQYHKISMPQVMIELFQRGPIPVDMFNVFLAVDRLVPNKCAESALKWTSLP